MASVTVAIWSNPMFGSKAEKEQRLARIVALLERRGALSQAEIAQLLGVPRSTILRDLPELEARRIYLHEDDQGRVSLARWW
jgi:predicted DNA-binding transcriptional regulator YafY